MFKPVHPKEYERKEIEAEHLHSFRADGTPIYTEHKVKRLLSPLPPHPAKTQQVKEFVDKMPRA